MSFRSISDTRGLSAAPVFALSICFLCLSSYGADIADRLGNPAVTMLAASAFPNASYDLLSSGNDWDDDCGDSPSAITDVKAPPAVADSGDVILLAKLDTEKKRRAGSSASKSASAAAPAAAAPAAAAPAPTWEILVSDKTLNAALARWAAAAGWQLLWELSVDYAVEAHTVVPGSFEEAVGTVAKSMETAEIPMKAIFYQGNKVLRVTAKGSE